MNSLNPEQLYMDPLLKEQKEKEKQQKKILLKKKSYIKQVNEQMKVQASVVCYKQTLKREKEEEKQKQEEALKK